MTGCSVLGLLYQTGTVCRSWRGEMWAKYDLNVCKDDDCMVRSVYFIPRSFRMLERSSRRVDCFINCVNLEPLRTPQAATFSLVCTTGVVSCASCCTSLQYDPLEMAGRGFQSVFGNIFLARGCPPQCGEMHSGSAHTLCCLPCLPDTAHRCGVTQCRLGACRSALFLFRDVAVPGDGSPLLPQRHLKRLWMPR